MYLCRYFPGELLIRIVIIVLWLSILNVRKIIKVDNIFTEDISAFEFFIDNEVLALLPQIVRVKS